MRESLRRRGIMAALCLLSAWPLAAQQPRFDAGLLSGFQYRNLGPFRAGSWVTDIAVPESPARSHLYTLYVGTRNGGVWKTTNNGTTFEPLFDRQSVQSIGAIALAPSDPDVIWVGTGEAYNARSSYYGDGVYRSIDGGRTWTHVGLRDSHHIARIVVDATNPDVAYVAAMGHLYSRNEERGVFKTEDGGRSWRKVLYVSDRTGAIDLVADRTRPGVLYAAMYDKERFAWHLEEGGPESGIYKTEDGGRSWKKLGGGLPTGRIGRIGLDIFRANPQILYAVIENLNLREPTEAEAAADRRRGSEPQRRPLAGEVYRTDDGGATWRKVNRVEDNVGGKAAYSFNQIRVDPKDDKKVYVTTVTIANSTDGGATWHDIDWPPRRIFSKMFGDVRALWIDPEDPDRIIAGTDGGVHISYDGGRTSDHLYNLPLGEIYALSVDMAEPYNIYAGLQDHESWKGPSNDWSGQVSLEDWITVGDGDGMYNVVDTTNNRWLYNNAQFGDHYRVDLQNYTRTRIMPTRPAGQPRLRFNWTPPIAISPHDAATIYTGAQVLLRSRDRGDHWEEISPDLTVNDPKRQNGRGNIQFATITTISESPLRAGLIWVGTDDGKVQVTRDAGASWTDATPALVRAGAPVEYWVSRVFASAHEEGVAYVAKTGYRNDDFRPLLYRTSDYGRTWTPLASTLPGRSINVVFEDRRNPNLLYVGTDDGVYVTIDGGRQWVALRGNPDGEPGTYLPAVPVHDLTVHPRENDLVIGTYGRGIFITDVTVLQELNTVVLAKPAHLFAVESRSQRRMQAWSNYEMYGDRHLSTPNEPTAITVNYYLGRAAGSVRVSITDAAGKLVRELEGECEAGLRRVSWDLRDAERRGVAPGEYLVTLDVDGVKQTRPAVVRP